MIEDWVATTVGGSHALLVTSGRHGSSARIGYLAKWMSPSHPEVNPMWTLSQGIARRPFQPLQPPVNQSKLWRYWDCPSTFSLVYFLPPVIFALSRPIKFGRFVCSCLDKNWFNSLFSLSDFPFMSCYHNYKGSCAMSTNICILPSPLFKQDQNSF